MVSVSAKICHFQQNLSLSGLQPTTLFFVTLCFLLVMPVNCSIVCRFVCQHDNKNNLTLKILSRAIKIAKVKKEMSYHGGRAVAPGE
jgi:hypothetical protein